MKAFGPLLKSERQFSQAVREPSGVGGHEMEASTELNVSQMTNREECFRTIFVAHYQSILAYSLRRVADAADAHDIVSETFTVAWRRLERIPSGDDSLPWLYGVARRCLANQRRRMLNQTRLVDKLSDDPSMIGINTAVVPSVEPDRVIAVREALDKLRPADREILRLAEWEELSHRHIALAVGTTENAVAVRMHRARGRLRVQLEALLTDESSRGDGIQ